MAIKRYVADGDNTITQAYESNLTTRGTGSNMGRADTLEVFHIFGQESSTSQELSRVIIKFPVSTMATDRTAGDLPVSGGVSFYLRMTNAEHASTIPRDATYSIIALSRSWEEGYGLDMESYRDLTYGSTGSNWIQASDVNVQATGTLTALATANTGMDELTIILSGTDGTAYTATADTAITIEGSTPTVIGISDMGSAADLANAIYNTLTGALDDGSVPVSASWPGGSSAIVTLYQTEPGQSGNTHINGTMVDGTNYVTGTEGSGGLPSFYSGSWFTPWDLPGGDFNDIVNADTRTSFDVAMENGNEDIDLDITPLVEDWIKGEADGGIDNYGVCLKLTSSLESSSVSQYTKKFFARSSEYFYKRPYIEARWDSSRSDNRGDFYFSSSVAPAAANLNTIYLYNYIRGTLQDIPDLTDGILYVSLYSGSDVNTAPSAVKLDLSKGGDVAAAGDFNATGGIVATGIYSASVAVTGTSALTRVFDVWHNDVNAIQVDAGGTEYHTGSIRTRTFDSYNYNPNDDVVCNITNLKAAYYTREKSTRFRLFTRLKDWNPNIYTKAVATPENHTISDIYYGLTRTIDDYPIIAYGTGSDSETKLSYDVTGSYFDLDISLLESGYAYTLKFLFNLNGKYMESRESFKFRVDK